MLSHDGAKYQNVIHKHQDIQGGVEEARDALLKDLGSARYAKQEPVEMKATKGCDEGCERGRLGIQWDLPEAGSSIEGGKVASFRHMT